MNTRFYNARILTMEEGRPIFEGEVHVIGGYIAFAGEDRGTCEGCELANSKECSSIIPLTWDREIDCHGNLLLPGFKNAHTHSGMTLLRS
jgi:5-methylthioadenosine/S-adenosylhomocysteine deaminase